MHHLQPSPVYASLPRRTPGGGLPLFTLCTILTALAAATLQGCAFYDFESCPEYYRRGSSVCRNV